MVSTSSCHFCSLTPCGQHTRDLWLASNADSNGIPSDTPVFKSQGECDPHANSYVVLTTTYLNSCDIASHSFLVQSFVHCYPLSIAFPRGGVHHLMIGRVLNFHRIEPKFPHQVWEWVRWRCPRARHGSVRWVRSTASGIWYDCSMPSSTGTPSQTDILRQAWSLMSRTTF